MDGFGLYQPPCPYNCKCTNGYPGECGSCLPGSADVSTSCSYNSALCDQCLAKLDYYNTLHTGLCVADALEFTEFMEPLCAAATIGTPLCMGLIWGSYFEGCHLAGEVSTDFCSSPAMNSCPAGGRRSHNAQKILEKQQRHHLIGKCCSSGHSVVEILKSFPLHRGTRCTPNTIMATRLLF